MPRAASACAKAAPIPDEAPVTAAKGLSAGLATGLGKMISTMLGHGTAVGDREHFRDFLNLRNPPQQDLVAYCRCQPGAFAIAGWS
jgi:hypothetical protein